MTLRAGLLLLCCPLLGCATAGAIRLDTGEGAPIVYTPARRIPPVEVDQREFEKAMTTLLLEMNLSLSDEGYPQLRLASTMEEPGGRYHRWCSQQSSPAECLGLLHGDLSLADASVRRQLALSFAWDGVWGGVWDGLASEIRAIVNPVMFKLMISTALAAYMGLMILPEPVTKAVAVALTSVLIAYVGFDAFVNILNGWRELSARSERATSFRELEDAGHRFGNVMGRDGARVIIMALTAALGGGAAHFASKAPMLPGFARAAQALKTNAGIELSFVLEGGARSVSIAEGVMTVGVAPHVVAAVATGSPGGAIRPSGLGSGAGKGPGSGLNRQTVEQLQKSKSSLERLIQEHRQKLADYKRDPFAFDNKGTLRNAPEELRSKIIEGRIEALEKQIAKQEGELRKVEDLLGGGQ